jgi:hypothetical protein
VGTPSLWCPLKMEVAYEDNLHMEIELENSLVHLDEVLKGYIYFVHVNLPIKCMKMTLMKHETTYTSSI